MHFLKYDFSQKISKFENVPKNLNIMKKHKFQNIYLGITRSILSPLVQLFEILKGGGIQRTRIIFLKIPRKNRRLRRAYKSIFQTFYVGKSLQKFRRLRRALISNIRGYFENCHIIKNQKFRYYEETELYMQNVYDLQRRLIKSKEYFSGSRIERQSSFKFSKILKSKGGGLSVLYPDMSINQSLSSPFRTPYRQVAASFASLDDFQRTLHCNTLAHEPDSDQKEFADEDFSSAFGKITIMDLVSYPMKIVEK